MTIKDVAQRSGYAVGTVSRVLNGHSGVSEAAREKILAVVEELNFRPNSAAQVLKQRESSSFAIIVKGTRNLLFAGIVEEMQRLIKDAGWSVSVYYLDEDSDEVAAAVQVCRERKPLGLLFLGGDRGNFLRGFREVTCPSVLVTSRADTLGFPNLSSVSTDDVEGAARSMGHLLDAGHRRIGIIGGDSCVLSPVKECNISQMRLMGCRRAWVQRGLELDAERWVAVSRYSLEGGYEAAGELLDRCPGMTAILAMSDVMAIGALRAIHDRGLRVPEDVSLVGYDGIEQSAYCVPRLTTIRQNAERLARRGVDILLHQANGGEAVHEIVPFELVYGDSVRSIREADPARDEEDPFS